MRCSIIAKDQMIHEIDFSIFSLFLTFCFTPCIMKRGSCCLLIVILGICIPYGDLTIQLVSMDFPLWVIFSCLGQSILSQLSSFELLALFFTFPIFQQSTPDTLFFTHSRISLDSLSCPAMVLQEEILLITWMQGHRCRLWIESDSSPWGLPQLVHKDVV